jgi:hypothetical protein
MPFSGYDGEDLVAMMRERPHGTLKMIYMNILKIHYLKMLIWDGTMCGIKWEAEKGGREGITAYEHTSHSSNMKTLK